MNIYALKGHRVLCDDISIGTPYQVETAKKYLTLNKKYTVEKTDVFNTRTNVYLEEFPDIKFNSVCFVDVIEQSEELSKQHPDYSIYH